MFVFSLRAVLLVWLWFLTKNITVRLQGASEESESSAADEIEAGSAVGGEETPWQNLRAHMGRTARHGDAAVRADCLATLREIQNFVVIPSLSPAEIRRRCLQGFEAQAEARREAQFSHEVEEFQFKTMSFFSSCEGAGFIFVEKLTCLFLSAEPSWFWYARGNYRRWSVFVCVTWVLLCYVPAWYLYFLICFSETC